MELIEVILEVIKDLSPVLGTMFGVIAGSLIYRNSIYYQNNIELIKKYFITFLVLLDEFENEIQVENYITIRNSIIKFQNRYYLEIEQKEMRAYFRQCNFHEVVKLFFCNLLTEYKEGCTNMNIMNREIMKIRKKITKRSRL